jgi:RecA/RadA recombinase
LIHIDFEFVIAVADRMCRSGAIDLICVDSVSALTPRAEIEVIYHLFVALLDLEFDKVAHV